MLAKLIVSAVFVASASAKLFIEDPTHLKYMWEQFKLEHSKSYATMEIEQTRFANFVKHLKNADFRNHLEQVAGGEAIHGITKFSDLSQEEFEANYLGAKLSMKPKDSTVATITNPVNATAGLVDWSGIYTTPVKDQGYCGSCWAFSATEQIESDSMRTLGTSYILSPEQITQCAKGSQGCNGGWTESAYTYVKNAGGIVQDSNYPYTSYYGVTGTCNPNLSLGVIGVTGYTTVSGESNMAAYVQKTGPLSVCLDASSWNSYTGGIMKVCGNSVDHCVQAVGVDASTGGYWKVRNSWGTSWGESGYIRLSYGSNTCDITNDPTYVATFKK